MFGDGMAGVTGLETVFFVSAGVQAAVTSTYAQQVVTRVRVIRGVWHALGMRLGFAEPAGLFHYAFGFLVKSLSDEPALSDLNLPQTR